MPRANTPWDRVYSAVLRGPVIERYEEVPTDKVCAGCSKPIQPGQLYVVGPEVLHIGCRITPKGRR